MDKRIVGIDFGMARIGLAVSDSSKIIAVPLVTIQALRKMDLTVNLVTEALHRDAKERGYTVEEIVVGMPLLMSGKSGLMADEVNYFISELQKQFDVPIRTWDERLTSVQAERSLRESNMSRKKRSKKVDTVAAVLILQNYLESRGL